MNNAIEVGDMVMVVRPSPCCGTHARIRTFIVKKIVTNNGHCLFCNASYTTTFAHFAGTHGIQLSRLIKISPANNLETMAINAHVDEVSA